MPVPPSRLGSARRIYVWPVLLLLWMTCPLAARADAFSWIAKAVAAKRAISFEGTQAILMLTAAGAGKAARPVHLVATVVQSGHIARMTYLAPANARGRVVIDDGRLVRQWESGHRLVLVSQAREETPQTRQRMLRLLRRNYTARRLGARRLNGLWCAEIALRPRTGHVGPTRLLWIERTHFAVLHAAEYNPSGVLCYSSRYQRFHYAHWVSRAIFSVPKGVPRRRVGPVERAEPTFQAAFQEAALPERLPCWLPSGYALVFCGVTDPGTAARTVVLRYGDGLKLITVTEKAAPSAIRVLPDASLPPSLEADMARALAPKTEARLLRALEHDFGQKAAPLARRLRRQGWGYDAIVALFLSQGSRASASPAHREGLARRWISAALPRS